MVGMYDFRHVAEQARRSSSSSKALRIIDLHTMLNGARKFGYVPRPCCRSCLRPLACCRVICVCMYEHGEYMQQQRRAPSKVR